MSRTILGLDIGTAQIKAIVAEPRKDGGVKVCDALKIPSHGVRRGGIVDIDEVVGSIKEIFAPVRERNRGALRNVFVNIGGAHTNVHHAKGVIAVSHADNEIYQDDVERVIKASQAAVASPNRSIIHTETKEFIVDTLTDITDPVGLVGHRLEVQSLVIDVFNPYLKNVAQSIELAGGEIGGILFGGLAASRAVLTKKQRELGVIFMDIGAGTVSMSAYEENKLLCAKVFPFGALNVTNDLAMGFKISVAAAENLKLHFGSALAKQVSARELIDLGHFDPSAKNEVARKYASEIIEARLAEIFECANSELKSMGKAGQLPAGVVLAGGGAKLSGIADLAKQELKLSAQVGAVIGEQFEVDDEYLREVIGDPEFVVALGLVMWGKEIGTKNGNYVLRRLRRNPLRSMLKYFMP